MPSLTAAGLSLIKEYEGLRLTAYLCPAGVWTIGYGHTGNDVFSGRTITEAKAERLLQDDLRRFEPMVLAAVKVPLTNSQYSALVSLVYNIGPGNFRQSTLLKKLNAGAYAAAAEQFLAWNRVGTVVLPGLVKRRSAERALFLKDDK